MKAKPVILFFIFSLAAIISRAQQKLNFTPITEPDTSLAPMEAAFNGKLGNVGLIGLGEATHGDKTTFAFNLNMVRYLVGERGYRMLIMEAPNSVCAPFNRFLQNDSAYAASQIDTLVRSTFLSGAACDRQFTSLIKWLKDYNLAHKLQKVSLKGMSVDATPAATMLNNDIRPYDPASAAAIAQKWKMPGYSRMDKVNDIFTWQDTHADLITRLPDTIKNRITNDLNTSKTSLELYLDVSIVHEGKNDLVIIDHTGKNESLDKDNFFRKLRANPDYRRKDSLNRFTVIFNKRDSLMAVYTQKLAGSTKAIVWAHNAHVSKPGQQMMGDYLNRALRDKYFTIITDYTKEGYIDIFNPGLATKKSPDAMAGHTLVKELRNKYGINEGIVFSTDLARAGYSSTGIHGAGIEGTFSIWSVTIKSFDAIAMLGTLYPRDVYQ